MERRMEEFERDGEGMRDPKENKEESFIPFFFTHQRRLLSFFTPPKSGLAHCTLSTSTRSDPLSSFSFSCLQPHLPSSSFVFVLFKSSLFSLLQPTIPKLTLLGPNLSSSSFPCGKAHVFYFNQLQ